MNRAQRKQVHLPIAIEAAILSKKSFLAAVNPYLLIGYAGSPRLGFPGFFCNFVGEVLRNSGRYRLFRLRQCVDALAKVSAVWLTVGSILSSQQLKYWGSCHSIHKSLHESRMENGIFVAAQRVTDMLGGFPQ
jgi:hypothetical protein